MERIRVIVTSTKDGSEENVIFTDDLETPAEDYCRPGFTVDIDEEIDELPSGFPMNYTLVRS